MSKTILLNHSNWHFTKENTGIPTAIMGEAITLPHTWNAVDGQDGGNDYYRGTCWYTLALAKPAIPAGGKAILQLDGAAMTAVVYLNGEKLAEHKGGYSTCRVDLLRRHLPRCNSAHRSGRAFRFARKRRTGSEGDPHRHRPCR